MFSCIESDVLSFASLKRDVLRYINQGSGHVRIAVYIAAVANKLYKPKKCCLCFTVRGRAQSLTAWTLLSMGWRPILLTM